MNSSKEKILAAVKNNQPSLAPLPGKFAAKQFETSAKKFQESLESIGGKVYFASTNAEIKQQIENLFPSAGRFQSVIPLSDVPLLEDLSIEHTSLQDVAVAIIPAQFGVAENGSIWVTDEELKIRILPFICENLVAILNESDIVGNMADAYDRIGSADYGFGAFIAGPSKTADIEQSLVLGAHGPKSMTVIIRRSA
ncbi:MAG: LutC/YkgG family protein [Candidatus Dadabacteria bacterium]